MRWGPAPSTWGVALVPLDAHAASLRKMRAEEALVVAWVVLDANDTWQAQVVVPSLPSSPSSCTTGVTVLLPPREQAFASGCTSSVGSFGLNDSTGVRRILDVGSWALGAPAPADALLLVMRGRNFGAPPAIGGPDSVALAHVDGAYASVLSGSGASAELRLALTLRMAGMGQDFANTAVGDADVLLPG